MNSQFDDLEMINDELGETIEGDGCERHISYYVGDHLVQLDLRVMEIGELHVFHEDNNIDDGISDRISLSDIQRLMSVLGVSVKEDIIDALIEKCKTIDCSLDWDKFVEFLQKSNLQYSYKELGTYVSELDENGNPQIKYVPLDK